MIQNLSHWQEPPSPKNIQLKGQFVELSPLSASQHAKKLFEAFNQDHENKIWDYLPYGPFHTEKDLSEWLDQQSQLSDPVFFAIKKLDDNSVCGVASYLRINPKDGTIEVGHINFAPKLQNTRAATEAMFLMMKWAFENGYRRYEWKCNSLNKKSRKAAQRFGFSYEGIFRQAAIIKQQNRDTAWFAIIDKEWQTIKNCYVSWLSKGNFDTENKQIVSLSSLTKPFLFKIDHNE